MDNTAEVYEFALAWVMGYDDVKTLEHWYLSLEIPFEEFMVICQANNWWVTSMDKLKDW